MFVRHLVEMIAAMLVGMAVLGTIVSLMFGLLGHSNVLNHAGLRAFLMTGYMIVGMALWMRHRRHVWRDVAEMSVAMVVPYALLVGPYYARIVSAEQLLIGMHVLMLPAMVVAMLLRRETYSQDRHHMAHVH
jgi:hypothetical protein